MTTDKGNQMNIYQRLNEVRKAVSYIQKDKQVSGGGSYMAITHDAVTAYVRDHLVTHGIMVAPTMIESKCADTGTTTSSGVPIIRYEATFDIAFINCDAPDDRHTMRLESHALDYGDKAPGKAISYATKYAMLKLFSIETGDAEEERIPAKGGNKIATGTITPTTGAWDAIPKERVEPLRRIGNGVIDYFSAGQPEQAYDYLEELGLDNDEKVALWTMLDSKMRSTLKKISAARKTETEKAPAR